MHRFSRYFFLWVFWNAMLLARPLAGQVPNYSLIRYSTDQGLSHDLVKCIAKDRRGFMWFGTEMGLNRFDGRRFEVFRHARNDEGSLPGDRVFGIVEDNHGRLWVATNGGICRRDERTGRFRRQFEPASGQEVISLTATSDLAIDRRDGIWFVANTYLVRLDALSERYEVFPLPAGLGGESRVFVDVKERIWVSVNHNVYRFDIRDKSFRRYYGRADEGGYSAGHFAQDSQGRLWCGTWGGGLYYYDERTDRFVDFPDGPEIATCILPDTTSAGLPFFWIGGGVDGLYLSYPQDGQTRRFIPDPRDPHSHNGFMAVDFFKDYESGIVWIATEQGIEKYDPYSLRFQRSLIPVEAEAYSQFSLVSSVSRDELDPQGEHYWIGVWGGGMYRWNRRTNAFQSWKAGQGLHHNEVFQIAQDRSGVLWVGGWHGVDRYDPRRDRWSRISGFLSTPKINHKVLSLLIDEERGTVWVGANHEGLFRIDMASGEASWVKACVNPENNEPPRLIWRMARDRAGRIWMASLGGVFRYDPALDECRHFTEGAPPTRYADHVHIGRDQRTVWVATRGGLLRMDTSGRVLQRFEDFPGLPADNVRRVAESADGKLWVGTLDGLWRLDPLSGEALPFYKSDGLFSNIITDGFDLLPSGELFIGFQNAFCFFDPVGTPLNDRPPPLRLTNLRVMNRARPHEPGALIVLRPYENVIAFEFAALSYSQPEKHRYAYRMEGFDKDWIPCEQPLATYTNLDGGRYVFRVKAANNDGVWSEESLDIPLKVIPKFHKAWYFPFFLLALGLGIVGGVARFRRQRRQDLETIRDRIARDLHDDMGSTLSSIRFFSEFAQSQVEPVRPEVTPILRRISASAAALSESMQDIIWTINSRHDQLEDLVTRMREFGFRMLEARRIQFQVNISENFQSTQLSIGQRRNIYLIFKEAINNAIKYSGCARVALTLSIARKNLEMIIEDDGQGFDLQQADNGNGLRNLRQRAAEIGGRLDIHAHPGAGTRIELRARLK
jgi:signal transduction histidine kinase/ligand-binding sensor domain-containing protein